MSLEAQEKAWSIEKRTQSFAHAFRGIRVFLEVTPNAWIHILAGAIVVILGFYLKVTTTEWLVLVLSMGLVFVTEAVNTAIEIDINLTSPAYHPYARDTKDVAAGAVLIAATIAVIVGLIIFLPKIL